MKRRIAVAFLCALCALGGEAVFAAEAVPEVDLLALPLRGNNVATPEPQAPAGFPWDLKLSLSWDPSTTPGVTYDLYRRNGPCSTAATPASYTKINAAPITATQIFDMTVATGTPYCYVAVAVDSGGVPSLPSNEFAVSLSRPAAPGTPRKTP